MATKRQTSGAEPVDTNDPHFEALLRYLRETRGFDFTGYKRASLARRVDRRMQDIKVTSYEEYLDHLQVHPDEFTALFNTICINVTDFFRDADAWQLLRDRILPELLARKPDGPIRAWSAGCASGQEACSLAILLADVMGPEEFRERVKIYGTDVDEEALAVARQATYSMKEVKALSQDHLERYFERSGAHYVLRKALRRAVIYGRNDLIQDAPISRIDLLACRNTLMYFNAETQAGVVPRLQFALNPGGVLFLGKAEMLISAAGALPPIDLKRRFFTKPLTASSPRPPARMSLRFHDVEEVNRLWPLANAASPLAQVVIDRGGTVAHINARARDTFNLAETDTGRPFQDLDLSYRPVELRSHLEQARRERREIAIRDVEWRPVGEPGGSLVSLDITIVPLLDGGEEVGTSLYFTDVSPYRLLKEELEFANRQLETAYEELQSTNEELETTNEELQSTVEELETTNEELQSTNEELETMNEELQSMNDELHSTNDELRMRTTEVAELNHFLESILTSLRAGVVVVGEDLRVRVWNKQAENLWGLRQDEVIGQHLLNLDIGLPVEQLKPMLRRAIAGDAEAAGGTGTVVDAVTRRGRQVTVGVTATPVPGADGSAGGAVLVMDLSGADSDAARAVS